MSKTLNDLLSDRSSSATENIVAYIVKGMLSDHKQVMDSANESYKHCAVRPYQKNICPLCFLDYLVDNTMVNWIIFYVPTQSENLQETLLIADHPASQAWRDICSWYICHSKALDFSGGVYSQEDLRNAWFGGDNAKYEITENLVRWAFRNFTSWAGEPVRAIYSIKSLLALEKPSIKSNLDAIVQKANQLSLAVAKEVIIDDKPMNAVRVSTNGDELDIDQLLATVVEIRA
jgi:hypothetical protein